MMETGLSLLRRLGIATRLRGNDTLVSALLSAYGANQENVERSHRGASEYFSNPLKCASEVWL